MKIMLNIPHIDVVSISTRPGLYVVGLPPRKKALQIVGVNMLLSEWQIDMIEKAGAKFQGQTELRYERDELVLVPKHFMSYEFERGDDFEDLYESSGMMEWLPDSVTLGHVFQ